ncbi:hypothetical protein O3M35_004268 [Rhynocoris fuscipes]|uniref:3'(2'),5'-bisphosphate nucleotidase 1 n=1 Tax=Rhynocoris fuscipes TaxID=488301 RepID=A0AAW1CGP4_9HEMI
MTVGRLLLSAYKGRFGKMANNYLYVNILATAVTAAERAGEVIRQVMSSGNLDIVLKGVNDPQTAADRSAQITITSILKNRFPKLTIIGEEGDMGEHEIDTSEFKPSELVLNDPCPKELQNIQEEDLVIWVDPLDGTNEFTQGLVENATVMIGLALNGLSVGGVIHQPYWSDKLEEDDCDKKLGRTIWGTVGGNIGGIEVNMPNPENLIITTTRSHSNKAVEDGIKALGASEVLRVGGAGYKVLLLLESKAHCYVFPTPGSKRWDICGPEAILTAAGGILTDTKGNKYDYSKDTPHLNSEGVLAALNPDIHKRCLEILNSYA